MAESFFHTLKTAYVYLETFKTREQARDVIFDYKRPLGNDCKKGPKIDKFRVFNLIETDRRLP